MRIITPSRKISIWLLCLANALAGLTTGYLYGVRKHYSPHELALIRKLQTPVIHFRVETLSITGVPNDEIDELIVRAVCLYALARTESWSDDEHRPNRD